MSDLDEMYQDLVLEHSQNPRNFRIIDQPSCHAEGYNPACGDRVSVFLDIKDGIVADVSFQGVGCAISTASASMMTEAVRGKSVAEAKKVAEDFCSTMTVDSHQPNQQIDDLSPLFGVKRFPVRVKCAILVWRGLEQSLKGS